MEPIQRVHHQLERCKQDFNRLIAVTDIVEVEDTWHDFLTHIDRFWNLADRYFAQFNGWREFRKPFCDARNNDELLKYLIVARNTVEHNIKEVQARAASNISIEPSDGGGIIRNFRIYENGSHSKETYDQFGQENQGPKVAYKMEIHLLPVEATPRRGVVETYRPPALHQGKKILPNVFVVASAGFDYYKEFYRLACEKFLTKDAV